MRACMVFRKPIAARLARRWAESHHEVYMQAVIEVQQDTKWWKYIFYFDISFFLYITIYKNYVMYLVFLMWSLKRNFLLCYWNFNVDLCEKFGGLLHFDFGCGIFPWRTMFGGCEPFFFVASYSALCKRCRCLYMFALENTVIGQIGHV